MPIIGNMHAENRENACKKTNVASDGRYPTESGISAWDFPTIDSGTVSCRPSDVGLTISGVIHNFFLELMTAL